MKKLTKLKIHVYVDAIWMGISLVNMILGNILFIGLFIIYYFLFWSDLNKYYRWKMPYDPIMYLWEPDSQREAMIY